MFFSARQSLGIVCLPASHCYLPETCSFPASWRCPTIHSFWSVTDSLGPDAYFCNSSVFLPPTGTLCKSSRLLKLWSFFFNSTIFLCFVWIPLPEPWSSNYLQEESLGLFLFSQGSQFGTSYCPTPDNLFFLLYFVQFSKRLWWEHNSGCSYSLTARSRRCLVSLGAISRKTHLTASTTVSLART